jgi:beta-catenin-like protein 1
MLKRKNKSLTDLVTTLRIYQENVDEDQEQLPEGAIPRKEVLQALIEFIEGC